MSRAAGRAEARSLFDAAFGPRAIRTPCSDEYKNGAHAFLNFRAGAVPTMPQCPYLPGTVQADAWFAGVEEGRDLWRQSYPAPASRPTPSASTAGEAAA